mmetsp:Transcript_8475/g.23569  ORF Transcript_8475/g.23569 Transcript_8475/m.23569 type:complete len:235 (-) Transcript_8475:482-1186(-)
MQHPISTGADARRRRRNSLVISLARRGCRGRIRHGCRGRRALAQRGGRIAWHGTLGLAGEDLGPRHHGGGAVFVPNDGDGAACGIEALDLPLEPHAAAGERPIGPDGVIDRAVRSGNRRAWRAASARARSAALDPCLGVEVRHVLRRAPADRLVEAGGGLTIFVALAFAEVQALGASGLRPADNRLDPVWAERYRASVQAVCQADLQLGAAEARGALEAMDTRLAAGRQGVGEA